MNGIVETVDLAKELTSEAVVYYPKDRGAK